jgi:hypothetical protein
VNTEDKQRQGLQDKGSEEEYSMLATLGIAYDESLLYRVLINTLE